MNTENILRQVIAVIILVVLAACNAPADTPVSSGVTQTAAKMNIEVPTETVIANQNWVVISKQQAEEMGIAAWLSKRGDHWTPSADNILKLEEQIAEYLRQNSKQFFRQPPVWERLEEYQRQYIGFEQNGKQIIYGNYFCDSMGKNWQQDFIMVLDGGDCFFQVEYDVESGTFTKLMVNGES